MPKDINEAELEEIKKLVKDFNANEQNLIKERTFFEIAGFPSRENVFSNVLKFYFDNRNNEHGFDTNILKALLASIDNSESINLNVRSIEREVTTTNYKRIDLVIETENSVIAIENKVYHVLNNDLDEYSNYLEENYGFKLGIRIIKIVLNLTEDRVDDKQTKFTFISYKSFLKNLKTANLLINPGNKYQIFFKEFIHNLENHFPSIMTKDQIQFLVENEGQIDKIKELSNRSVNYINTRTSEISKLVTYNKDEWEHYSEVADSFEVHSKSEWPLIRIACTIEISKIYIEVTSNKELLSLKSFLENRLDTDISANKEWLSVKVFSPLYEVENKEVSDYFLQILALLEEFITMQLKKEF